MQSRSAVWLFAVLLATFVVYAPSLTNDFTWDDRWAAMGDNGKATHPLVAELRPLREYFENHYWPHRTPVSYTYRPVTTLSFALRHALVGDDPVVAHLLNVLLHVGCALLLFVALRRLSLSAGAACFGTAVFGLHALHSEAVANLVGRAELLGFGFGMAATLVLETALQLRGGARAWRAVLAAVLFAVAFFSKESALAWVGFAPLFAWAARVRRRQRGVGRWQEVVGVMAVTLLPALVYLALRVHAQARMPGVVDPSIGFLENPLLDADAASRVLTGLLTWGYGLWLVVAPFGLAADYGPAMLPVVSGWQDGWAIVSVTVGLLVGVAVIAALWNARRAPLALLAVAAFCGFSFIVTNIPFPVFMMFAERTYFMPSMAVAFAVAAIADMLERRRRSPWRPIAAGVCAAWLAASALHAGQRCTVWKDDETLVRREVLRHPESVRMQLCAGALWWDRGDATGARRYFEAAARLDPDSADAWCEVARACVEQGDHQAAARALQQARAGRPREAMARRAEIDALAARLEAASPR